MGDADRAGDLQGGQQALAVFRDYCLQFLEQLTLAFDECEDTRRALDEFAMLSSDEIQGESSPSLFILSLARSIGDHVLQPLPDVPYRAAVVEQRGEALIYDAYAARDVGTIAAAGHPVLERVRIEDKLSDRKLDEESKHEIFRFIEAINDAALESLGQAPPSPVDVPVSAEPTESNESNESNGSLEPLEPEETLEGAFHKTLGQLKREADRITGGDLRIADIPAVDWHDMMSSGPDASPTAYDMCSARNWEGVAGALGASRMAPVRDYPWDQVAPSEELWGALTQANLLGRLCAKTPPHLLEIIGDQSKRIAEQIAAGGNVDVMNIGQSIMHQCNVEDLQLFTQLVNSEVESILYLAQRYARPGQSSAASHQATVAALRMIGGG
jgi:hypothetical protein